MSNGLPVVSVVDYDLTLRKLEGVLALASNSDARLVSVRSKVAAESLRLS